MSRLIDADAILPNALTERQFVICREDMLNNTYVITIAYQDLANFINSLPTVDAVEVVRCENCIMHNDCKFEQYQGLNGFCSLGERKENG